MAISSYSDLVSAVPDWLERSDIVTRIPDFIALAEAKFNRLLRCYQMEQREYANVALTDVEPQFIQLPGDFQTMRRLCISNIAGKPRLEFRSSAQMLEYRNGIADVAGQPVYFTVFGNELELCPTPNQAITLEMIYRGLIPGLSTSNATNWLIITAPDLYLYGTLLEAAMAVQPEDKRIPGWAQAMQSIIDSLNKLSIAAMYGTTPLQVRVSGPVF